MARGNRGRLVLVQAATMVPAFLVLHLIRRIDLGPVLSLLLMSSVSFVSWSWSGAIMASCFRGAPQRPAHESFLFDLDLASSL